jgi:transposase-like protein
MPIQRNSLTYAGNSASSNNGPITKILAMRFSKAAPGRKKPGTVQSQSADLPRYRCKICRPTFNALTKKMPLARLRHKKWATQAGVMINGVSTATAR